MKSTLFTLTCCEGILTFIFTVKLPNKTNGFAACLASWDSAAR
jgi:hypothetical protein